MSTGWYQTHHQELLETQLRSLFPHYNILKNSRKKTALTSSPTKTALSSPPNGLYLEVDVWVPDVDLCLEYQDYYHYKPAWYCQIPLNTVQQMDDIKRSKAMVNHQTFVVVPCWWAGDAPSLKSTLQFYRPDLGLRHDGVQISPNPPVNFFEDGRLMLASFPESNVLETQSSWWIGEKWDGIRCFWNTHDKQLYSRSNIMISSKEVSQNSLGNLVLDCELWCGRGSFSESETILANSAEGMHVPFQRLMCFDEASTQMHGHPFEKRYSLVLSYLSNEHPSVIIAPRFLCSAEGILQDVLQSVTAGGGEGVMMRQPLSRYLPGRSESLFKIKTTHTDFEALVVEVLQSGSLMLQLPNGFTFSMHKSACILHSHASKGDVVSLHVDHSKPMWYHSPVQEGSQDYFSSPVVYRIRSDLSWDDVLATPLLREGSTENELRQVTRMVNSRLPEQETPKLSVNFPTKIRTWKLIDERRSYFDKFAYSKGKDPLSPDFWYGVLTTDLMKYDKNYYSVASYYGNKLSETLLQLYPDIGLQRKKFKVQQSWKQQRDRKAYFDRFAASKGSDPLNPDFWYGVTTYDLARFNKGYRSFSTLYGKKLSSILMQLYPDIGLQSDRFKALQSWGNKQARRKYFDDFAASKGMDPLNPIFWYKVTRVQLRNFNPGFDAISGHHGGKLVTTLMQLYPDIGLQPTKFKRSREYSWKNSKAARAFFDKFAASKGGNPLLRQFWRNVTAKDLVEYDKRYRLIAGYYGGRLSTILAHLYPNMSANSESDT